MLILSYAGGMFNGMRMYVRGRGGERVSDAEQGKEEGGNMNTDGEVGRNGRG